MGPKVIVDVFMFDDEFDMLDCRLYQLAGIVDRFIAIEGNTSFTGIPKEFHLSRNIGRFRGYPLDVVKVDMTGPTGPVLERPWMEPGTIDNWWRESIQRNGARRLLADLPDDTVLIYGDVDEIPRRYVVKGYRGEEPQVMAMTMLVYSTKLWFPAMWAGPVIGRKREIGIDINAIREVRWHLSSIPDAGWHLSWFGNPERREEKLKRQSHQELASIAGEIGSDYPARHLHVDGKTPLLDYGGDLPHWIAEGNGPQEWMRAW